MGLDHALAQYLAQQQGKDAANRQINRPAYVMVAEQKSLGDRLVDAGLGYLNDIIDWGSTDVLAQDSITVQEYYKRATPVNDPNLPKGLRYRPFNPGDGTDGNTFITSSDGKPITFKLSEFSNYYFSSKYGSQIKKIFSEGGTDIEKLNNLLKQHPNESSVGLYRDGYFILGDSTKKVQYIFRIGKDVAEKIFKL